MHLTPVGLVQNSLKKPTLGATKDNLTSKASAEEIKKHHKEIENTLSDILIFEPWHPLLKGIEAFSHILVLYWPHLIDPERRNLKQVHPMGNKEIPLQGIFAHLQPGPTPTRFWYLPLNWSGGRKTN